MSAAAVVSKPVPEDSAVGMKKRNSIKPAGRLKPLEKPDTADLENPTADTGSCWKYVLGTAGMRRRNVIVKTDFYSQSTKRYNDPASLKPRPGHPLGTQRRAILPHYTPETLSRLIDLPDPRHWAAQVARCTLEILEDMRPLSQLQRWVNPTSYRLLQKRLEENRRGNTPQVLRTQRRNGRLSAVRVLSAHCQPCEDGGQEATVVLFDGQRARAAALSLEIAQGHWLVSRIRVA